ncbi:MAG: S41 family peptidase, partial [Thermodesulfobacteriota bacterium]|nr:S41 family peptidase [Thermodesulfobacteriota bacterium]
GALQDHKRAVIIGTQTFGKGTVQTIYPLEDGSALKLTTALYYTPSGKSIQAEGIIPDILVSETMADEPSKNIRFLREKDLKHHISGENEDISSEEKVSEDTKEEEKQDVQLERAIEILKGWEIFKTSDVLK